MCIPYHDPWLSWCPVPLSSGSFTQHDDVLVQRILSPFHNQVNDEISRQIYDELDKQLDAQMMAELEKCQDEQCRRMDEELDRQVSVGSDTTTIVYEVSSIV